MKKNIFILIFLYSLNLYGEVLIPSANDKIFFEFDTKTFTVANIKSNDIPIFLKKIELGLVLDNELIELKEINRNTEYIFNSNIIKVTSKIKGVNIDTFIYTPFEDESRIYINSKIQAEEMNAEHDIKLFYYFNSKLGEKVYKKNQNNYLIEQNMKIKSLINPSNFYLTTDSDIQNLKLKTIYQNRIKKNNEKILLITDLKNLDDYDKKEDFVVISFDPEIPDFNKMRYSEVVEQQLPKWNFWHSKTNTSNMYETEKNILKQNFSLLKTFDKKDCTLYFEENIPNKLETKLKITLSFLKGNHIEEGLNNVNCLIGGYFKNNSPKDSIDYRNLALFLEIINEYLKVSTDNLFLKRNYKFITANITEVIYEKLKDRDGLVSIKDGKTYYALAKSLKEYANSIEWFASDGLISKYKYFSNKIIFEIEDTKLNNIKISDLNIEDLVFLIKTGLLSNDNFTQYLLSYQSQSSYLENNRMLDKIILINSLYQKREFDQAKILKDELDKIIKKNKLIIPEFIKENNNVYKYGKAGIDLSLSADYILMIYNRNDLRSKYGYTQ